MTSGVPEQRRGLFQLLVGEWREIGGLGRLALLGVVGSGVLAVVLGFSITAAARGHLLDARSEILSLITEDLVEQYPDPLDPASLGAFDAAVRERLLGGETVRVKMWARDGTVVYSDEPALVGERFELAVSAARAFQGERSAQVSDLSEPAHADHRHLGSLIEFYLPFIEREDGVVFVVEIEQRTDRLESALGRIERNVWLSIGAGLGVLGVFLGALALARARDLNQRRRQAEQLLGASLRAQEEERRRVVGSLHDDIGQPLYRLLYGLEGTRARMDPADPLRDELEDLAGLVHEVDDTLRAELRILHQGLPADLGLEAALRELAETVRVEAGLDVDVVVEIDTEPGDVPRRAIFRAAAEALTNVRKHAEATRAQVEVATVDDVVELTVTDDGTGAASTPGLGLTTTRERLEAIGGFLEVQSRAGVGTVLRAGVPTAAGVRE